jgi:4-hydroxybenzoate polyprenyltransferase
MTDAKPYKITQAAFWGGYWTTFRPYMAFVSGVSGLVGLAVVPSLSTWKVFTAFVTFFFIYGLGQALTDIFQVDTDSISSPYRPLTRGLITRRQVVAVSVVGMVLCAAVFFLFNPKTLPLCIVGILGILTYTPMKRRFWAGPLWISGTMALLPWIASLCGKSPLRDGSHVIVITAALSVFFSFTVFRIEGYFKDISADRVTGYNTVPVRFGWIIGVMISLIFWMGATASSISLLFQTGLMSTGLWWGSVLTLLAWAAGMVLMAYSHWLLLKTRKEDFAFGGIGLALRGYVLLHLGEAAAINNNLVLWIVPVYFLFEVLLALRPVKSQI